MDRRMSAKPNAGGSGVTALLAALPEEIAPLRRRLEDQRWVGGDLGLVLGRLGPMPVALGVTGDGPWQAQRGLEQLFGTVPVRGLLAIGISGALSPELCPGDLLLGARVVDEATAKELRPLDALLAHAEQVIQARRGVLVSARQLADTPAAKRDLLARFAEGEASGAVDLESYAYARAAESASVPWLCLRSISDAADESLPELLERSRGASGGVSRSRVALGVLREPGVVPTLWRLKRRLDRSALLLAHAAVALLSAEPLAAWSFAGSARAVDPSARVSARPVPSRPSFERNR
jgi:adenosylhomocysteine nucleosidase